MTAKDYKMERLLREVIVSKVNPFDGSPCHFCGEKPVDSNSNIHHKDDCEGVQLISYLLTRS